jgi:hypothetical protein
MEFDRQSGGISNIYLSRMIKGDMNTLQPPKEKRLFDQLEKKKERGTTYSPKDTKY